MRRSYAVIGAGISGMSAALILARQGHAVTLVDQAPRVAPTLRGFSRHGVFFDTGFHYSGSLGPGEILDVYFRFLGLRNLKAEPLDQGCFDLLRYPNVPVELGLPVGHARMRTALVEAFPREKHAIDTYLADIRQEFAAAPFLNLDRPLRPDSLSGVPSDLSLADYLHALTSNAVLTSVLSVHCLLHGVPPEKVPFAHHAKIEGSYLQSVHGVRGGGRAIIHAFEQALRAAGVVLRCGTGARQLLLRSDGAVRGVELGRGETIPVDAALCTTHPAVALDLLPPGGFRPAYVRRIRALIDTPSAYMLFGVTEGQPELCQRNIVVCPETRLASAFAPGRHPAAGPFYVAATQNADQRQGVVVIAPGSCTDLARWADSRPGRRPPGYKRHKHARLASLRAQILRHVPELAGARFIDGATPLTLRDFLRTPTGSLYGVRHGLDQFNPAPVTRVPGLYLAGQSVVAPGILGAVVSAVIACGFLLGHDTLRKEIRLCI